MADTVTTATAGVPEHHVEETALGIPAPGWVALSMLVVVAIMIWQKVPALIARTLDARIAIIRKQLDDATAIRAEAEALLNSAKTQAEASTADAAAIVDHAQREARTILASAEAQAVELTARRTQIAEDKIAAAERSAIAEVRARAASAAAAASRAVIAAQHDAAADRGLVDQAIGRLN